MFINLSIFFLPHLFLITITKVKSETQEDIFLKQYFKIERILDDALIWSKSWNMIKQFIISLTIN